MAGIQKANATDLSSKLQRSIHLEERAALDTGLCSSPSPKLNCFSEMNSRIAFRLQVTTIFRLQVTPVSYGSDFY